MPKKKIKKSDLKKQSAALEKKNSKSISAKPSPRFGEAGSGATKRGKDQKSEKKESGWLDDLRLHPDTKKSVMAVLFFALAIILLLANFQSAGPAGNILYAVFGKLLGAWGYYLIPLIFIVIGGVFLTSERRKIYGITFFGAFLFVLSGLGLIDIVFNGEKGGLLGIAAGSIESLFGYTASLVLILALAAVSFLITLNLPIRLKRKKKDDFGLPEDELSDMDEAIIEDIKNAGVPEESADKKDKAEEASIRQPADQFPISNEKQKANPLRQPADAIRNSQFGNYIFPPLDLLRTSIEKPTSGDLRANANIIKRTLESFGIPVEMGEINVGPKVTRYTLKPAEGVKLSKITALSQDMALALAAHPIRIEAPIPGKSLVGIEVPNKAAAVVRLGSLMNYGEFMGTGPMSFAVGRDVTGEPMFSDIKKMPHLLVAGSTGSGKSVTIHSIILSLLYKNSPNTLKFLMIDPKRVELSIYEGIPHLIAPVVTQAKKSLGVFRWAINEMDRRYEILLRAGSRDIQSYNKKNESDQLPYVVIIVDEMADLMSTFGREVEGYIVRLAQMARATGIHLILSTQRPSVEVITGLIKANITARIALQVASQIDSRTILDTAGAEKLLGGGDMLIVSSELSKPRRIQGAYISEEEISKVANFIKEKNRDMVVSGEELAPEGGEANGGAQNSGHDILELFAENNGDDEDDLYEDAVSVVAQAEKASASLLQRRLKVGYARAARLLDIMEEKGLIGPARGANPREVYIKKE